MTQESFGESLSDEELKRRTMEIYDTNGLIPAVRFYRAVLWRGGQGRDPGLMESLDMIRHKWAREIVPTKRKRKRKRVLA
jgi:hypothetical protein